MAYLPTHLTRHELLTAAERAYLDGLDLPSRVSVDAFTTLASAVLASRVDGYHQDPNTPHWKPAALIIYPAIAREGEDGLTASQVAAGATYLRDCQQPARALALLMRVEQLKRDHRKQQALRFVTTADKLPARTSDRAAQQHQIAASLDCQQQTGHTYHDIQALK